MYKWEIKVMNEKSLKWRKRKKDVFVDFIDWRDKSHAYVPEGSNHRSSG